MGCFFFFSILAKFIKPSPQSNVTTFSSPQKETPYSLRVTLYSSSPGTANLLSVLCGYLFWTFHINGIMPYGLLYLTFLIYRIVLKVHPCCSMFLRFIPFVSLFFSHSVVSDSLWPHGLQHPRLPCPSPTPGSCSNSYPSSWWCYPTISFSVIPFSSCLQFFPASGSFPRSQFFISGSQSTGISASVLLIKLRTDSL